MRKAAPTFVQGLFFRASRATTRSKRPYGGCQKTGRFLPRLRGTALTAGPPEVLFERGVAVRRRHSEPPGD
jgi:hypothetical protein